MMRTKLLLMSVLLFLMTGCSNDDEQFYDPGVNPIFGYWEYTDGTIDGPTGFLFEQNGVVKHWEIFISTNGRYSETKWGQLLYENDGSLYIESDFEKNAVDRLCYSIKEVTKERLVIRVFGGFAGTPYEKGYDKIYKRLKSKPTDLYKW